MQIVIDIDENVFTRLFDNGTEDYAIVNDDLFEIAKSIRKGTPLPKGHGRLIDADELEELFGKECVSDCGACMPKRKTDGRGRWYDTCSLIDEAPTIIKSDKEDK